MKTYVVGGAVRDRLLGLPVVDRDHVVVGATVDEMLAAGFKPVGRDFPVFLHPVTHEEYALARTERKVAAGYAGFVVHADPSVTLEDDLERRDLTINAMAEDESDGRLVDPHGGQRDLAARCFRHVGPAFVEDPVRLLRVARFAARFVDFTVAPETLAMLRAMSAAGEVDALVPERVWQEVARGLMEARPSRMLATLREADALARVLPEVDALFCGDTGRTTGDAMAAALDRAATAGASLEIRYAIVASAVAAWPAADSAIRALSARIAVPGAARDLAIVVARERDVLSADAAEPAAVVAALERSDAFRRASRFDDAIAAIACTIDDADRRALVVASTTRAARAARAVDVGAIARAANFDPARIADETRTARASAVAAARHAA